MSTPSRAAGAPSVRFSKAVPSLAAHAALMALHETVREVTAARLAVLHPYGASLAPLEARAAAAEAAMADAELTYMAVLAAAAGLAPALLAEVAAPAVVAPHLISLVPNARSVDAYVMSDGSVVCGPCCAARIDPNRPFDSQARYSRRRPGTRCAGVGTTLQQASAALAAQLADGDVLPAEAAAIERALAEPDLPGLPSAEAEAADRAFANHLAHEAVVNARHRAIEALHEALDRLSGGEPDDLSMLDDVLAELEVAHRAIRDQHEANRRLDALLAVQDAGAIV